ncbi:hypothetical protein GQR36_02405 [Enterococcus termitis]
MYTIGYISLNNQMNAEREKALSPLQCIVQPIDKKEIIKLFEGKDCLSNKIDTLIVEDEDFSNINWICEMIMYVRKQSDIPLWIVTSSDKVSKTSRIVYLQLGADGVIDYERDLDETILVMRNLMNRFKQSRLQGTSPKNP